MTPSDLRSDPELAILDALDHAIKLTVYALVAIYPELTDSECPFWRRDDPTAQQEARYLIDCSEKLERAVCRYRTAILSDRGAEANDDLPF